MAFFIVCVCARVFDVLVVADLQGSVVIKRIMDQEFVQIRPTELEFLGTLIEFLF